MATRLRHRHSWPWSFMAKFLVRTTFERTTRPELTQTPAQKSIAAKCWPQSIALGATQSENITKTCSKLVRIYVPGRQGWRHWQCTCHCRDQWRAGPGWVSPRGTGPGSAAKGSDTVAFWCSRSSAGSATTYSCSQRARRAQIHHAKCLSVSRRRTLDLYTNKWIDSGSWLQGWPPVVSRRLAPPAFGRCSSLDRWRQFLAPRAANAKALCSAHSKAHTACACTPFCPFCFLHLDSALSQQVP